MSPNRAWSGAIPLAAARLAGSSVQPLCTLVTFAAVWHAVMTRSCLTVGAACVERRAHAEAAVSGGAALADGHRRQDARRRPAQQHAQVGFRVLGSDFWGQLVCSRCVTVEAAEWRLLLRTCGTVVQIGNCTSQ